MAIEDVAHIRDEIRAIGVDLNPLPAFEKPKAELRQGDVTQLPVADESVDFGYSFTTLIYVQDALKALEEAWRVMRPGAQFYFDIQENAICLPGFQEVLKNTPGGHEAFTMHTVPFRRSVGYLEVRKTAESTFTGFPYELVNLARPADIEAAWVASEINDYDEFARQLPTPRDRRRAHHKLGIYQRKP